MAQAAHLADRILLPWRRLSTIQSRAVLHCAVAGSLAWRGGADARVVNHRADILSGFMTAWQRTLRDTIRVFGSQRKLWAPFLFTAFGEALLISLVWLAPHPPASTLLAPLVRYAFGEGSLHYPRHLWLLYHVMAYTHIAATFLIGAYLSGVASIMVRQTHEGQPLSMRNAIVSGQVRYSTVLLVWLVSWLVANGAIEGVIRITPPGHKALWINVGAILLLQTLFAYPIPAAVFDGVPWWKALWRGMREAVRYPLSTLAVVAAPSALLIGFAWLLPEGRVARWMMRGMPEIAVGCVVARLAVMTVADALLTISVAHLWWCHRKRG